MNLKGGDAMFGSGQSQQAENKGAPATAPATGPAKPAGPKAEPSIISADLTVTGDIITPGDLTVEGAVDGSITCHTLTLGGTPDIKGDVTAETVRVCGAFSGTIAASQVHLVKSAVMKGDIRYRSLTIDQGAFFEGKAVRMKDAPPAA